MAQQQGVVLRDKKDPGFEIAEGNYADKADEILRKSSQNNFGGLTTTKLRGMYGQIVNVGSKVTSADDFDQARGDVQYLKVKMAYEAGRTDEVKCFLENTHLLALLDDVSDYGKLQLYYRYAESLVAYFKYYGGKD